MTDDSPRPQHNYAVRDLALRPCRESSVQCLYVNTPTRMLQPIEIKLLATVVAGFVHNHNRQVTLFDEQASLSIGV